MDYKCKKNPGPVSAMLITAPRACYSMALNAAPAWIAILVLLFSCGCTSDNLDTGPVARPPINDTQWVPVLDTTYRIAGSPGPGDNVTIPVEPDTAYNLSIDGPASMELALNPDEKDLYDAAGNERDIDFRFVTFATRVYGFWGIIRTDPYQKNLVIRLEDRPRLAGTLQNVHVVLERYNGTSAIAPVTTEEERRYSPH